VAKRRADKQRVAPDSQKPSLRATGYEHARPGELELPAARPEPVRVFVADERELFRKGLCALLAQRGLDVVGEASDGTSVCDEVQRNGAQVVVIDLDLPEMSGVDVIRRLAQTTPHARALVFTLSADPTTILEAVEAGAHGYLLKEVPLDEIVGAVWATAAGGFPISPRAAASLFERLRGEAAQRARHRPGRHDQLTGRELEVLRLLVEGQSNSEIADRLYISAPTVKHHISSILLKLGVGNRVQAAVRAARSGIV
jgi:DNA-binding NarL/FixJ family response regulator